MAGSPGVHASARREWKSIVRAAIASFLPSLRCRLTSPSLLQGNPGPAILFRSLKMVKMEHDVSTRAAAGAALSRVAPRFSSPTRLGEPSESHSSSAEADAARENTVPRGTRGSARSARISRPVNLKRAPDCGSNERTGRREGRGGDRYVIASESRLRESFVRKIPRVAFEYRCRSLRSRFYVGAS